MDEFALQRAAIKALEMEKIREGGPGSGRRPGGGIGAKSIYNADMYLLKKAKLARVAFLKKLGGEPTAPKDKAYLSGLNKKIVKVTQFWSKASPGFNAPIPKRRRAI